jgi:hypothetical protein
MYTIEQHVIASGWAALRKLTSEVRDDELVGALDDDRQSG